ncbi:MAG TPA: ACP phosphodiesterase [Flavisolibacter sp.]|jgi:acyl carrier protein phosphodiesterase|nr:ACP phosphodiesterase [Flavisolibacter sp.]
MNYLAHAYLSYNRPFILVGNMISDFVKGRQKLGYTAAIQNGIVLHRAIDHFTDSHPATASAKEIFRPHYRLYSGPIMDVVYDHFLANDPTLFSDASLLQFTQDVYQTLEGATVHLPPRFLHVLTYMKMQNWLYHYRTPEGIERTLRGLVRRASFLNDSTQAFESFLAHYAELKACYEEFFPDVKQMAKQALDELPEEF